MKPIYWLYGAIIFAAILALTACTPDIKRSSPDLRVEANGGHGSAVHIGNGYAVTAAHVVGTVAKASVKFGNGQEAEAEVLWRNVEYDIAVIRYVDKGQAGKAALSCSIPQIGDNVRAVGNPTVFEFLTMRGYVAGTLFSLGPWREVVPVDMSVIPGMSGGAVYNDADEVVGISVGTGATSLGFGTSWVRIGVVVPGKTVCDLMGRSA